AVVINPTEVEKHIGKLLSDPSINPQTALYKTSYGLYVLPSHVDLAKTESGMRGTDVHALKSLLEPLERYFEYILVDTPPSESMLTANALTFANEIIIPLQAHYFAMEGLAQAMEQIEKVKR